MELDAGEGSVGEDLGIAGVFLDTVVGNLAPAKSKRDVRHTLENTTIRLVCSRPPGNTWVSLARC